MTSSASYGNAVQELYVTYFGRPADPGGLSNFAAALASAGAPTDLVGLYNAYAASAVVKSLIDSFGTSSESIKLYGDTSTQAGVQTFVNDVFENLFGRSANAAGLTFWSDAILSGSVTQGDAALAIAAGAAQNTTAQGVLDAKAVANKVAVASEFTTDLQTTHKTAFYSGAAAAAMARELLNSVSGTTDPSGFADAIGSTLGNLANPNGNMSFYLTPGIDHLTGGSAGNAFIAVLDNAAGLATGGTASTLNTGDVLIGGSGTNGLTIYDEGKGGDFALPSGITLTNIASLEVTTSETVYDASAPNGALDLSKSGFTSVGIFDGTGTNAIKVAPGASLDFSVNRGSVTTYGGASVIVTGDGSLQNQNAPQNTINGDASTKSVEVDSGWSYLIKDANSGTGKTNSITSVTAQVNYGNLTIDSDALNALVAANEGLSNVITINAAAGVRSLAISLDGDNGLTISDQTATSVSIATVSLASSSTNPASTKMDFQFASAGTISISGAIDLSATTFYAPDASKIALAGSANFNFSSMTLNNSATIIDASASTGAITLNATGGVVFLGGSGVDTIGINNAPGGAISGGTSGKSELILSNYTDPTVGALSTVSHFATLGTAGTTSGTFDLSTLSGIGTLDLRANAGSEAFTHVSPTLNVDINNAGNVSLTLQTADTHGASDTQTVYIGSSTSYGNLVTELTVEDAGANGIGTLDLVSNSGLQTNYGFGAIIDPALAALNLSGAATIQVEAPIADTVAQLAISSNAGSSTDYIAGVADANLSGLSVSGSVRLSMGTIASSATSMTITDSDNAGLTMVALSDAQLTNATFTNSSTATLQLSSGFMSLPALAVLNLNGNVAMSVDKGVGSSGTVINGASDNANFSFNDNEVQLGAGNTDSITLGSGNHIITLGAGLAGSAQTVTLGDGAFSVISQTAGAFNLTAGSTSSGINMISLTDPSSVNITLGNGHNQIMWYGSPSANITLGTGSNSLVGSSAGTSGQITFAAHTTGTSDSVTIGALGTNVDLTHILVVSGLNNAGSDSIYFMDSYRDYISPSAVQQVSAAQVSGDQSQLASWVAAAVGQGGLVAQAAGGISWFQFGGNTYLVETPSANDAGVVSANDAVVELTGVGYTFAHAVTSGSLQLKG